MKKTHKLAIVLMISVSLVVVLIAVGIPRTRYHEESFNNQAGTCEFGISDLRDCNVSISFTDDSLLLYSIDIEVVDDLEGNVPYRIGYERTTKDLRFYGTEYITSVDFVLGTGLNYNIILAGRNLNTTITYDNDARLIGINSIEIYQTQGTR